MDKCCDFYSISEFARLLGVHPQTIRNGIKCGRILALRVGKGKTAAFRIPYTELQRMIKFDFNKVVKEMIKEFNETTEEES